MLIHSVYSNSCKTSRLFLSHSPPAPNQNSAPTVKSNIRPIFLLTFFPKSLYDGLTGRAKLRFLYLSIWIDSRFIAWDSALDFLNTTSY